MESEQEWQFITNEIQNKTGNPIKAWKRIQKRRDGLESMVNL